MKLLSELIALHEQTLAEEAIEVKLASDVWAEGKDAAVKYISSTLYLAKPKDGDEDKMEVFTEVENKRKPYATMPTEEFEVAFSPISKSQKPDVEGYSKYRDAANVEAFKYDGDTVKIDAEDGGAPKKLTTGDYLLQSDDGENFTYFVEKAEDFEAEYSEK